MSFERNLGFVTAAEQALLADSCVAIAGVGGDGGQTAETLARMGVGRFVLADPDRFAAENLNRQNGANARTLGQSKAVVIAKMITEINPAATVDVIDEGVTPETVERFLAGASIVIDEIDYEQPAVSVLLARACRERNLAVISGVNVGFGTVVTAFEPSGYTLERYLAIPESASLEQVASQEVRLDRWIRRLPTYVDLYLFSRVAGGELAAPSVAPGVAVAAALIAVETFKRLAGRGGTVTAPRARWIDLYEHKARQVRLFRVPFTRSLLAARLRR